MYTEDEAITKWCPMVRAGNEAGCNRNGPPIINGRKVTITHCIASECMWWVRVTRFNSDTKEYEKVGWCGAISSYGENK